MANRIYPKGLEAFLKGEIDWSSDTIKIALVTTAYSYSAAHDFYNDVSANVVGTPQTLGSKTTTSGTAGAANPTFTSVAGGSTIGYLLIYRDSGTAGTSALIALMDTASLNGGASGPINLATSGVNIAVTFDASGIFTL